MTAADDGGRTPRRLGRLLSCALLLLLLALGSEMAAAQAAHVFLRGNITNSHGAPYGGLFVFEGETQSYSVWLAQRPASSVTVSITGHESMALSLDRTSLTFTPSNWDIPQHVLISSADNQSFARNRGVLFRLLHTLSDGSGANELLVFILDDDGGQEAIALPLFSRIPEGGSGSVGVRLKTPITQMVTIDVFADPDHHDSAQRVTDRVTVSPTSLVFTPSNWNRFQQVNLMVTEDDNREVERFYFSVNAQAGTPGWTITNAGR